MEKALIETRFGTLEVSFFRDTAPAHVENFLELARNGFYDGCLFHRVIPGFMIQGGDPNSRLPDRQLHGTGGSGKNVKAEFSGRKHVRGTLSMARSQNPDSASSQFFIVLDTQPHLDGQYSAFGEVTSGMDVVDKIAEEETDFRDNPVNPVEMKITLVEEQAES